MNAGFEDITLLINALDEASARGKVDWEALFSNFSASRKPDADAIADMAVENFVEMRDKVGDPHFLLAKEVEKVLQREFPGEYYSRYSLVTFSRVPYRQAQAVGQVSDAILAELCKNIKRADQVDLGLAATQIRTRMAPLLRTFPPC